MSRISSQGTKFYIETADVQVGTATTTITKAKPAVVSMAALPAEFDAGAFVLIEGTGWKSLDDKVFQIGTTGGATVTLHDSDTVDEAIDAAVGTITEVEFMEFCVGTLNETESPGTDINVTTMCDAEPVTVAGNPGVANWTATGFWDSDDAAQQRVREVRRSADNVAFVARFRDDSGLVWVGSVKNFDVTAGVDQGVAISVGGTVSGGARVLDKDTAPIFES